MAGPNVEPTRRKPWIAWIVVLAMVGVVVWLITAYAGGTPGASATAETAPGAVPADGAAADGRAADGKAANGHANGHANGAADRDTVTDLSLIARGDKNELDGKKVRLTGVTVESVAGKQGFWIGGPDGQRVFAKTKDTHNVSQGQTVDITGELDKVPDEIPSDWGLQGDQANSLKQLGLYIDVDKVTTGTQP